MSESEYNSDRDGVTIVLVVKFHPDEVSKAMRFNRQDHVGSVVKEITIRLGLATEEGELRLCSTLTDEENLLWLPKDSFCEVFSECLDGYGLYDEDLGVFLDVNKTLAEYDFQHRKCLIFRLRVEPFKIYLRLAENEERVKTMLVDLMWSGEKFRELTAEKFLVEPKNYNLVILPDGTVRTRKRQGSAELRHIDYKAPLCSSFTPKQLVVAELVPKTRSMLEHELKSNFTVGQVPRGTVTSLLYQIRTLEQEKADIEKKLDKETNEKMAALRELEKEKQPNSREKTYSWTTTV
eukprot:TRINITY_DN1650_c0_g1_i3.p1 TRINITY_DN1650_c0_g1~~TRINITY_DN1650_c0_g1_i3.p1  ORF type:complete len:293 (-),score=77.82 TRINITY_DN1650_c0_g1_i3:57-935(-)